MTRRLLMLLIVALAAAGGAAAYNLRPEAAMERLCLAEIEYRALPAGIKVIRIVQPPPEPASFEDSRGLSPRIDTDGFRARRHERLMAADPEYVKLFERARDLFARLGRHDLRQVAVDYAAAGRRDAAICSLVARAGEDVARAATGSPGLLVDGKNRIDLGEAELEDLTHALRRESGKALDR